MLDKLWEFLGQFWDTVKCFAIVPVYERGVHLRNGKLLRTLEPGFWFKLPVFDEFMTDTVVPTTNTLHEQTLTTIDGLTVVIRGVVTLEIANIVKFLLQSEDQGGVMADTCYAAISEATVNSTWAEIQTEAFVKNITKRARKRARKYGINIIELRPMDLVKLRAYRLIGER